MTRNNNQQQQQHLLTEASDDQPHSRPREEACCFDSPVKKTEMIIQGVFGSRRHIRSQSESKQTIYSLPRFAVLGRSRYQCARLPSEVFANQVDEQQQLFINAVNHHTSVSEEEEEEAHNDIIISSSSNRPYLH